MPTRRPLIAVMMALTSSGVDSETNATPWVGEGGVPDARGPEASAPMPMPKAVAAPARERPTRTGAAGSISWVASTNHAWSGPESKALATPMEASPATHRTGESANATNTEATTETNAANMSKRPLSTTSASPPVGSSSTSVVTEYTVMRAPIAARLRPLSRPRSTRIGRLRPVANHLEKVMITKRCRTVARVMAGPHGRWKRGARARLGRRRQRTAPRGLRSAEHLGVASRAV